MGGACMGIDERDSVVDADLRVHGVRNLFVASAAVFPDGSPQLPTLPLMALTLRLAEHLHALAL
jgi:choline dehydrogenase-like flavoprotein